MQEAANTGPNCFFFLKTDFFFAGGKIVQGCSTWSSEWKTAMWNICSLHSVCWGCILHLFFWIMAFPSFPAVVLKASTVFGTFKPLIVTGCVQSYLSVWQVSCLSCLCGALSWPILSLCVFLPNVSQISKRLFFFFFLQCATQEVGAPLTKVAVGHSEGLGTKGSRVSLMSGHPISVNTTQPKKPSLKISLL